MEVISNTTHVARKEHQCNYCGCKIERGQTYNRQFNKYDDVYVWKSHDYCSQIASELNMFDDCNEGVTEEDFKEHINEAYSELNEAFLPEFKDRLKVVISQRLNIQI